MADSTSTPSSAAPAADTPLAPNPASSPAPETQASATPEAPEAPKLEDVLGEVDFSTLTDAEVRALESGDKVAIAKALKIEAPAAETKTEEPPAPQPAPEKKDEPEAPHRISLKAIADPEERRAVAEAARLVREGKHKTLRSALTEVMNLAPQASAPSPQSPEAPSPQTDSPAVAAFKATEAEIERLNTEVKAARAEFAYDKALDFQAQLTDARATLERQRVAVEREQQEAQAQTQAQRDWETNEEASRAKARELFPALDDPESEFSQLVEDEIILAERRQPDIFNSPDWPEKIAARVNEKHGKRLGGEQPQPASPATPTQIPAPPPKDGVRMPGSPVGNGANTSTLTAQTALAQLESLPTDEQDAVLASLDDMQGGNKRLAV